MQLGIAHWYALLQGWPLLSPHVQLRLAEQVLFEPHAVWQPPQCASSITALSQPSLAVPTVQSP
jgi:hypothetical protein